MLLLMTALTASSLEQDMPLQVSPLLKLLLMRRGDQFGDDSDRAWTDDGIDPTGRTIVDVGLHGCDAVVDAVRGGFVVHGFEPAPAHMANCHQKLNRSQFHDAPVAQLVLGKLAPGEWWAMQRRLLQSRASETAKGQRAGFAFLYQAALSNESAVGQDFTVGAGGSSSLHMPLKEAKARGKKGAQRVSVPVLRLDEAVDEDLWLLKMDTEVNSQRSHSSRHALTRLRTALFCPVLTASRALLHLHATGQ